MLVGFVGLISGYDGSFEFKSGEAYPESVPFTAMRIYLALFGAAMVPIGWYTAKELRLSMRARHIVTLMVLFGEHFGQRAVLDLPHAHLFTLQTMLG